MVVMWNRNVYSENVSELRHDFVSKKEEIENETRIFNFRGSSDLSLLRLAVGITVDRLLLHAV